MNIKKYPHLDSVKILKEHNIFKRNKSNFGFLFWMHVKNISSLKLMVEYFMKIVKNSFMTQLSKLIMSLFFTKWKSFTLSNFVLKIKFFPQLWVINTLPSLFKFTFINANFILILLTFIFFLLLLSWYFLFFLNWCNNFSIEK